MSEALQVRPKTELVASGAEWVAIQEQARTGLASGFFPKAINSAAKAVAVMLAGRELGLPPMQSIRSVNIIDGKPCLSAETMLALAYQRVPGLRVEVVTTPTGATVTGARGGAAQAITVSFTKENAIAAGLLSKQNWQKYPEAMFRARAISAWCRVVVPDAILGCYTPEEVESIQPGPAMPPERVVVALPAEDNPFDGVDGPGPDEPPMEEPGASDGPPPAPTPDPAVITEKQAKRLWAIAKSKGLADASIKSVLGHFGYEHTRDIRRADYEKVISQVESWS